MADYWMKLYIEILDDPKMATLPDRVWRRIIELFLVAKRLGKDGHMPDTRQIAWMLRMNPDDLESDLSQVAQTGIVIREVNGWFIPKFAARQVAVPDAERKAQERTRKRTQQYYGDVTEQSRSVTQSTEDRLTEDRLTEQNNNNSSSSNHDFGALCNVYEKHMGPLTPLLGEKLADDLGEYGLQMCMDAITEALRNNVRKWSYVQGILKNWGVNGKNGYTPSGEKVTRKVKVDFGDGATETREV